MLRYWIPSPECALIRTPMRMRRSLNIRLLLRRDRPLDRSAAWVCLATNQFVTPGLGSIIAGRVWFGVVQVSIAGTGFCFVMAWFFNLFKVLFSGLNSGLDLTEGMRPYAWEGKLGLALFFAGWLLALLSSISIVREAPPNESPKLPPRL